MPRPPSGGGLFGAAGQAVRRLQQADVVQHDLEPLAVLGQVDGVQAGAQDRHPVLVQRMSQLQRSLAAELDDAADQFALRLLDRDQLQHVLGRQGFEIEAVGGVVVGRDRFRIAVHHDAFDADVSEGEGGVAAAVVELDPLPDPVRPAAEDDGLLRLGRLGFADGNLAERAGLIGRIHIGGGRGELGRAGVDALEHRADVQAAAGGADLAFGGAGQMGKAGVGKAH